MSHCRALAVLAVFPALAVLSAEPRSDEETGSRDRHDVDRGSREGCQAAISIPPKVKHLHAIDGPAIDSMLGQLARVTNRLAADHAEMKNCRFGG